MDDISRPRKFGGWGLLDMRSFGNALLCKSLLRGIFGEGPWSLFINRKYLKGRSIEYWYRRNSLGIKRGSAIWHSLRKIQSFYMGNLRWRVFLGSSILIGFDSIMNGLASPLPHAMVSFFHSRGIFTWDKLIKSWSLTSPVWKDEVDLLMPPSIFSIWSSVLACFTGIAYSSHRHKGCSCMESASFSLTCPRKGFVCSSFLRVSDHRSTDLSSLIMESLLPS